MDGCGNGNPELIVEVADPMDAAECLLFEFRSSFIFLFLAAESFVPATAEAAAASELFSDNRLLAAPRPLRDVAGNEDRGGNLKSAEALRCFSLGRCAVFIEEVALAEVLDSDVALFRPSISREERPEDLPMLLALSSLVLLEASGVLVKMWVLLLLLITEGWFISRSLPSPLSLPFSLSLSLSRSRSSEVAGPFLSL